MTPPSPKRLTLNDLPPRSRQVAELVGKGLPCTMIAKRLGISTRHVYARINKIAGQIRAGGEDDGLRAMMTVLMWVKAQAKNAA